MLRARLQYNHLNQARIVLTDDEDVVRGAFVPLSSVATLEHKGVNYVAFSHFWTGLVPSRNEVYELRELRR